MRHLLASIALIALAPVAALAADLPVRAPAPTPMAFVPGHSWTGFYLGAQVGWQRERNQFQDVDLLTRDVLRATSSNSAFIGGVHMGYNHQMGSLVLGVEADIEAARTKHNFTDVDIIQGVGFPWGYRASTDWQGSLRARLGLDAGFALLYVTGGLAVADGSYRYFDTFVPGLTERFSNTRTGWTAGAGVEYALGHNWSARVEYRYTDLGRVSHQPVVVWQDYIERHETTSHAVRVGVSYRFGGPAVAGPVVARY